MTKKQEKARNMRYKKAALQELNYEKITDALWEISSECDNVRYAFDDDSILNALDGDEEQEFEFKMLFSDLSAECEELATLLQDTYIPQQFDDLFVGIMCRGQNPFHMVGYDSYEEDYYNLIGYECTLAENTSYKRLMTLTKSELIDVVGRCFRIAFCYMNVTRKYDYLKASFDILKDRNTTILQTIRELDDLYNKSDDNYDWSEFDKIAAALPARSWVE